MKRYFSFLLVIALCFSLSVTVFASGGEAPSGGAGGGGALPSSGNFGDVKTAVVNNSVILIESDGLVSDESMADTFKVAEDGYISQ